MNNFIAEEVEFNAKLSEEDEKYLRIYLNVDCRCNSLDYS